MSAREIWQLLRDADVLELTGAAAGAIGVMVLVGIVAGWL